MNPQNVDRRIVICPSAGFIRSLPNAKVPDRSDFVTMSQDRRMRAWREVVERCRELADDLHEVLERGELAARLAPL